METKTDSFCNQRHELALDFKEISQNETRTLWVVLLTTVMMVVEIASGYATGSMALLADGYHMASHAGALGISYFVYRLARSKRLEAHLNFGTGKLLPLGGYTSAIGLGIIALWMAFESIERFIHPVNIEFNQAIMIAGLGLFVNIASAAILGFHGHDDHHENEHQGEEHDHHVHDHNHKSALVHILADALTSITAIFALTVGKLYSATWLDPLMGIVGSLVILRWAYSLCKITAWELLDGHPSGLSLKKIKEDIERDGHKVLDLHAWNTGPSNMVCTLSVIKNSKSLNPDFRSFFKENVRGLHLIVEENH